MISQVQSSVWHSELLTAHAMAGDFPSQVPQMGPPKVKIVVPLGKILGLEAFFNGHEFIPVSLG